MTRRYYVKSLPYYFSMNGDSIDVVVRCFEFKLYYQILKFTLKFSTSCSNAADTDNGYFYPT